MCGRTFPPDVNFLKVEGMDLSKEATALGFPIEHRHKLSCLRQELIGKEITNFRQQRERILSIKHDLSSTTWADV